MKNSILRLSLNVISFTRYNSFTVYKKKKYIYIYKENVVEEVTLLIPIYLRTIVPSTFLSTLWPAPLLQVSFNFLISYSKLLRIKTGYPGLPGFNDSYLCYTLCPALLCTSFVLCSTSKSPKCRP